MPPLQLALGKCSVSDGDMLGETAVVNAGLGGAMSPVSRLPPGSHETSGFLGSSGKSCSVTSGTASVLGVSTRPPPSVFFILQFSVLCPLFIGRFLR